MKIRLIRPNRSSGFSPGRKPFVKNRTDLEEAKAEIKSVIVDLKGFGKSVKDKLVNCYTSLLEVGTSLFRRKLNDTSSQPSRKTKRIPEQLSSVGSSISLGPSRGSDSRSVSRPQPSKKDKTYLKIDEQSFQDISPNQLAVLLLQEIKSQNVDCDTLGKGYAILGKMAAGMDLNAVVMASGGMNLDVISKHLNKFLRKITNNESLANRLFERLSVCPEVIEPVESPERAPGDDACVLPMIYPADLSVETLERIEKSRCHIGITNEDVECFLGLVLLSESAHSNFSQEEVNNRITFLDTISAQINEGRSVRLDLNSLQSEYKAFQEYCTFDETHKRFLGLHIDNAENRELCSYHGRLKLIKSLDGKKAHALKEAKTFTKNLITLDKNQVEGAVRLLERASTSEFPYGFYVKAEAAINLRKTFNGVMRKMTLFHSEITSADIVLETENSVYYVKVKSNLEKAISGLGEIRSLTGVTNLKGLVKEDEKTHIPVCLINKIGDVVDFVRDRVRTSVGVDKVGIGTLVDLSRDNSNFVIWDINGKDRTSELKRYLQPEGLSLRLLTG